MPRKARELVAGGVYHVFARGNRRQPIFFDDDDRRRYLDIWGSVVRELEWRCLAYCLMDNHVHHVVETPNPDLSRGVQLAHGAYGRYLNDSSATEGHVFEGRFGSSPAATRGDLWYFVSYVVLNPVRASVCTRPEDYRWSSHAAVLGKAPRPAWLDTDRLRSLYATKDMAPLDRYRQIVEAVQAMDLVGHGSNREFSDHLDRLASRTQARRDNTLCSSRRLPVAKNRRARGSVPDAVAIVLGSAGELRASDIHDAVEALLGEPVSRSTVKNCLTRLSRGGAPRFERRGRGVYRLAR